MQDLLSRSLIPHCKCSMARLIHVVESTGVLLAEDLNLCFPLLPPITDSKSPLSSFSRLPRNLKTVTELCEVPVRAVFLCLCGVKIKGD